MSLFGNGMSLPSLFVKDLFQPPTIPGEQTYGIYIDSDSGIAHLIDIYLNRSRSHRPKLE
jgi:hypothetical protein